MPTIVKTYGWENARSDIVTGGCTFKDISVWEVSGRRSLRRGTVLRGRVSMGSVHEEASIGELSVYEFISETLSEQLL